MTDSALNFNFSRRHLFFSLVVLLSFFANARAETNEEREGQALAAELRTSAPDQNSETRGVLKIRSSKQKITNNIPVVAKIVVCEKHWESIYETSATSKIGAERLIVRHFPDQPNEYLYARAESPAAPLPEPKKMKGEEADIPLAGSDFWLSDLGLDFLHWPIQRRLADKTRLDRDCFVLESGRPNSTNVASIKSSIDKESKGILVAEASDSRGDEIKKFTISGTGFRKVKGQWQVQRIEMFSTKRGSKTTLEFDRPEENSAGATKP